MIYVMSDVHGEYEKYLTTPTLAVSGKPEIFRSHNNILIDCGATYGGRLACLCLDTMREYYI